MTKLIGVAFTCSKEELKEVITCLDPTRIDWVVSEYVEELVGFLEKTLADYKEEESE